LNTLSEFEYDLKGLDKYAKKISKIIKIGDIFLLKGELGVGKTTFARSLINFLFDKNKIIRPSNIKSPSFPIMINYSLSSYEINHYDLYRLSSQNELDNLGFFEDLQKNISIIEWPEIILNNYSISKYYLIEFKFIDKNKRFIKTKYFEK